MVLAVFSALLFASPAAAQTFPELTGRVVDQAELLSPLQRRELAARSEALERRTTDQFVIVTLRSLEGHTIEDFSTALGNHWRLGLAGRNNGILLVVAPSERRVRIAVGDGMLRALPNEESQRIIDRHILPSLRQSRWFEGVNRGSSAIVARLTAAGVARGEQ